MLKLFSRLMFGFLFLITAFILAYGAVEYFPDHGLIEYAIFRGDTESVRTYLKRGADPNTRKRTLYFIRQVLENTERDGFFPDFGDGTEPLLLIAIQKQKLDIARLLLTAGADPNGRSDRGTTVLSAAALSDDPALVQALLEKGADPRAVMPDGSTALHEGPQYGRRLRPVNRDVIRLLKEAGSVVR